MTREEQIEQVINNISKKGYCNELLKLIADSMRAGMSIADTTPKTKKND